MNIHEHGFELLPNLISSSEMQAIRDEIQRSNLNIPKYGIRHADKKFNSIKELSQSSVLLEKAESLLNAKANLVRVIFFNKTPEHNWLVTWHQDKTICVDSKAEIQGWKAWSFKDGVHHVQPELCVLSEMVTFRIHLDDTNEDNGCLKVIPCSHKNGILLQSEIDSVVAKEQPFYCSVNAGDALVMRPHLLHSSSKSTKPSNRRIVHLEFSSYQLPCNLNWV